LFSFPCFHIAPCYSLVLLDVSIPPLFSFYWFILNLFPSMPCISRRGSDSRTGFLSPPSAGAWAVGFPLESFSHCYVDVYSRTPLEPEAEDPICGNFRACTRAGAMGLVAEIFVDERRDGPTWLRVVCDESRSLFGYLLSYCLVTIYYPFCLSEVYHFAQLDDRFACMFVLPGSPRSFRSEAGYMLCDLIEDWPRDVYGHMWNQFTFTFLSSHHLTAFVEIVLPRLTPRLIPICLRASLSFNSIIGAPTTEVKLTNSFFGRSCTVFDDCPRIWNVSPSGVWGSPSGASYSIDYRRDASRIDWRWRCPDLRFLIVTTGGFRARLVGCDIQPHLIKGGDAQLVPVRNDHFAVVWEDVDDLGVACFMQSVEEGPEGEAFHSRMRRYFALSGRYYSASGVGS
jgi:hypothetical protein